MFILCFLQVVRDSIGHNMAWIDPETLKACNRNEWVPLLHNVCMLHSALRLRHVYGLVGLNKPYEFDFNINKLWVSSSDLLIFICT